MRKQFLFGNILPVLFGLVIGFPSLLSAQDSPRELRRAGRILERLSDDNVDLFESWQYMGNLEVDSVALDDNEKEITVFFTPAVSHVPVREAWIRQVKHKIKDHVGWRFRKYDLDLICRDRPLESYVPLYYSSSVDSSRMAESRRRVPLVGGIGEESFPNGLEDRNIALWASHGYYYEAQQDRWEWQRARLFGTVEDIFPFTFTRNYLVPMLEDAGAYVFLPRERDTQVHEVIVDNDGSTGRSQFLTEDGDGSWEVVPDSGFAARDTLKEGENPFRMGSYMRYEGTASSDSAGRAVYVPDVPEGGEYAVYISWAQDENAFENVSCVVNHTGGNTSFRLNQQMGFGTWIYVGTFHFAEGLDRSSGSVVIEAPENSNGVVTADAVRLGGGTGHVARRPAEKYVPRQWSLQEGSEEDPEEIETDSVHYSYKVSGMPRWMEAGRYYMQYAGMPDTLVYSLNEGKNDYNDDYESRGEWVNYLMGAPNGPEVNRDVPGLNIPIDLAFAFHTDAGITPNDSVIGTLGIYSSERDEGEFPNGRSKLASRDLTDMIQSQIVTDLRLNFDRDWTRRAMWDREYSEAWRPNVPTMLLELLSHQNLADMKHGLDPRFRFTVARAIYKGMARFLAAGEGREVKIKPLAPDHMSIEHLEEKRIRISWRPVDDPTEPTASPTGYRVYRRQENNGFDNGTYTSDTSMVVELPEYDTIYSFKVSALNDGGRSFPGETLSVSLQPEAGDLVLVVNGFDRVAPPSFVDGDVSGVAWWADEGVPWHQDFAHTGRQYDFDRSSPWLDDDSPGHGASYADMEGKIIPGNDFDHVVTHGEALREAGYSFVSVSDEVFESPDYETGHFFAVDLLFGEERGTEGLMNKDEKDFRIWTDDMQKALGRYIDNGGNVLASGAYIATDMAENEDSAAIEFAKEKLGYEWMSNHADNVGDVVVTDRASPLFLSSLSYNADYHPDIYKVEAPDALEPVGDGAFRLFRYSAGKSSAGIGNAGDHKNVVLGFPFETITSEANRNKLMEQILSFFRDSEE
ncbi:MAG: hypothetical protein R6U46_14580 [Marinilabilia sp.]